MKDEVLLFSGATEGCGCPSSMGRSQGTMARRKSRMSDPYSRTRVKKRSRRRRSSFSGIQGFGQTTSMAAQMGAVKEIVYTGAIAGAGAIATDFVWGKIGDKFNFQNEMLALAKIATGIGLGIVIAKFLKKPRLGVAFAIGPVVVGVKDMLKGAVGLQGVPYVVDDRKFQRAITAPPFVSGVPSVGPGTPEWLDVESVPHWNYAY